MRQAGNAVRTRVYDDTPIGGVEPLDDAEPLADDRRGRHEAEVGIVEGALEIADVTRSTISSMEPPS